MDASDPENGERRERRTGVVLGVLATLVLALGIALAVVLASDDDGGSDDPDVTAQTSATQAPTQTATVTVTEPPAQTTTTTTTPSAPTITQPQAKAAAARAASAEAAKGGIGIPPSEWDVRCTAAGGGPRATRWTCQAAANGGQCSGTIAAYARAPDVAATTDPRIGCGE